MGLFRNASTSAIFAKMTYPLLTFALVIWILYIGKEVFVPLSFACLMAILLTTPARWLEKLGIPRGFAALICVLVALTVFIVIFYFISSSVVNLRNDFPMIIKNIEDTLQDLQLWVKNNFKLTNRKAREIMETSTANVIPNTSSLVNTAISTVSGAIFTIVIVTVQTFLLLLYRSLIIKFFVALFADELSPRIYGIFDRTRFMIRSYIVGLFIELIIVAAAYAGALYLLGVKYAFFSESHLDWRVKV